MAEGVSKGKVNDVFEKRVKNLAETARATADSFKESYKTARKWAIPDGIKNLCHVPSLHMPAWDRYDINKLYSSDILNGDPDSGGTCADLIAMKVQNDFLAAEERAFRLRHASYTRCAAMMHGRFNGQGQPETNMFEFIKSSIEKIVAAGQSSSGGE